MQTSGFASTGDLDHAHHVVAPGAFDDSIKTKGLRGPRSIKLLWQHHSSDIVGRITRLETRDKRLWIETHINEKLRNGAEVAEMIRTVDGLSYSVGFFIIDAEFKKNGQGKEYLFITKGELDEVSIVTSPAQPEAIMTSYKEDKAE